MMMSEIDLFTKINTHLLEKIKLTLKCTLSHYKILKFFFCVKRFKDVKCQVHTAPATLCCRFRTTFRLYGHYDIEKSKTRDNDKT